MNFTKESLVEEVLGICPNLNKRVVKILLEEYLTEVKHLLSTGHGVHIKYLGTLFATKKKERLGRNPKTGEPAVISARTHVGFKKTPKDVKVAGQELHKYLHNAYGSKPEYYAAITKAISNLVQQTKGTKNSLQLRGFGSFRMNHTTRKGQLKRNPRTGEIYPAKEDKYSPHFRASKDLLDLF